MTTVETLAALKRLDPQWLREQGVDDLPGGGVSIAYHDDTGEVLYRRKRDVPGGPRFETPKGVRSVVYGREKLSGQDTFAVMHLCEGESDCWALWAAGLPAVAVPGNNCTRCLTLADLGGAPTVYVCMQRTPDNPKADSVFRDRIAEQLRKVGFAGNAYVVLPPPGVKDFSDARAADPEGFASLCRRQIGQARLLLEAGPPFDPDPPAAGAFPEPIPASLLKAALGGGAWLVNGLLRRGEVTLLSALWKSGKTTLLAHMLRAFEKGTPFLGRAVEAAKVLYVTEESEARWAARRDAVGIEDHVEFLVRPFKGKPDVRAWESFVTHLGSLVADRGYDLVVMDTLANLWSVRDENDASAVQSALMPLHQLTERAALQLVHHTRKSDGAEATASRGSGALTGFVDTILEFRRYLPGDRKDRRRVLTGFGRDDDTPDELVVELTTCGYVARGDRDSVSRGDLSGVLAGFLPRTPPGLTVDQILDSWPADGAKPGRDRLAAALKDGASEGKWVQTGEGRKGSPYLFFMPFDGP